jgi:hypothetical protein
MWKTIVLCASLFASAALGLATGSRWFEPALLPAAGAIGLCLIGVVLILAAPRAEGLAPVEQPETEPVREPSLPVLQIGRATDPDLRAGG